MYRRSMDDVEELSEMYGLPCWQGCDADSGGLKITMWYDVEL